MFHEDGQTYRHDESNSHFSYFYESAKTLFLNLRFGISPKGNLTRWVSVSVLLPLGVVLAVLGAILLVVAICLIIGALKVSEAFTFLSTL